MKNREDPMLELFRDPALAWVLDRIVQRLERGEALSGAIRNGQPTIEECRAIDNWFGRKSRRLKTLSVSLDTLAETCDLGKIVAEIRGPVINRRAEREAENRTWQALQLSWQKQVSGMAWAEPWIESLFSSGVLKRFSEGDRAKADSLLNQAWAILKVPVHNDVLLASLAASVCGDSHALDRGRALAGLCLRGIHEREGIDGSENAEARRDAWSAIGVTLDDLSAPALCLNLRAEAGTELAPWIDWHVARGEPFFLPWRQLRRFVPSGEMDLVFVCENPTIISEAAHRLGPKSRPLVCMVGLPSTTIKNLVRKLRQAAIEVSIRADFDWAGLRFVDQLRRAGGVTNQWRMSVEDYLGCSPSQPLKGTPFAPEWAGGLPDQMKKTGRAVYEEELIEPLIADLRT